VKERPILFGAPMVRAILAGAKTQTRRMIRIDDTPISEAAYKALRNQRGIPSNATNVRMLGYLKCDSPPGSATVSSRVWCPYGMIGDRLWVRETHAQFAVGEGMKRAVPQCVAYRATCNDDGAFEYANGRGEIMRLRVTKWTPGIYMPRWASRITLEVTGVRVERLHEVAEVDARAEGATPYIYGHGFISEGGIAADPGIRSPSMYRAGFEQLWREINGCESWAANPWVWVVEFKRLTKPIGELIAASSIGAGLRDIKERGIDAHLVDLEQEMGGRRR
jgi:hypothetical protein